MARLYTVGFELQSLASEIPAPGKIIVGAISAVEVETTVSALEELPLNALQLATNQLTLVSSGHLPRQSKIIRLPSYVL
jgi:hypothetical protein